MNSDLDTLRNNVSGIINIFRYVFDDDKKMLAMIDTAYEQVLLSELRLIPTDIVAYVNNYLNIVKQAYKCFDIGKFSNIINTIPNSSFPSFSFNSFNMFVQGLNKFNLGRDGKARIMNLTTKFKPLFMCIDKLVNNTKHTFDRLAQYESIKSFDDLM